MNSQPQTLCCLACRRSYLEVLCHIVTTLPGQGLTAWCTDCDPVISLGEKKSLITLTVNQWRECQVNSDLDAIEDAGHRQVEWEMSRQMVRVGSF